MPRARDRCGPTAALPAGLALLGLLGLLAGAAPCAAVTLGGNVQLESDYRYRGQSYSDEKPDLRLSLALDHEAGGYAGGALVLTPHYNSTLLYAGYSAGRPNGLRWDAGVSRLGAAGSTNVEAYAGLAGLHWSARLALSPDYFGHGGGSAYLEAEGHWPLPAGWQLALHAGRLHTADGPGRSDARLALVTQAGGVDWMLAATAVTRGGPRRFEAQRRHALVAAASWAY